MEINATKSKVVIFCKNKRTFANLKFYINNKQIDIVTEIKYLGLLFSYTGNLKTATNDLYKKALKAYFKFYDIMQYNGDFTTNIYMKIFDMIVKPILTYNSEIWIFDWFKNIKNVNLSNIDKLPFEKLNHKFCKHILGIHKKASNLAARLELGQQPIIYFILKQTVKYYKRLLHLSSDRLLYDAYLENKIMNDKGQKCWLSFIKQIEKQTKCNFSRINIHDFHNKLVSSYNKECEEICKEIKLNRPESNICLYAKLNFDPNIKEYLQLNTNKEKRNIITKFRTRTHGLPIEIDQYKSPPIPYTKRKCSQCNDINDEIHMLLYCKKFDSHRKTFLENLKSHKNIWEKFSSENDINKLNIILNPSKISLLNTVTNFLKQIMKTKPKT